MTKLHVWAARGLLVALATYLTWRHIHHWHLDELVKEGRAIPWVAAAIPFESVSAILVAVAWLAALLFPFPASVRSASKVGVGIVVVAVLVAVGAQVALQTAAATHFARRADNHAWAAENAAERTANAAEQAASVASEAKDACEQE